MFVLGKIALVLGLVGAFVIGQDTTDSSNEDTPVLLDLGISDQFDSSFEVDDDGEPIDAVLGGSDGNKVSFSAESNEISASSEPSSPSVISLRPSTYESPSRFNPFAPRGNGSPRLSLVQSFLAGRAGASAQSDRISQIAEAIRNFNVTGRLGKLRQRLGRFPSLRLQTNEDSFTYRAGRRIGLFFQSIGRRIKAWTERLRERAATAAPTA